jgi:hypothetical protein
MKNLATILFLLFVISCRNNKNDAHPTEIASTIYDAQANYFDRIIGLYNQLSDTGQYYFHQDSILKEKVLELKAEFKLSGTISSTKQREFLSYFENTFNNSRFIDFKRLNQLKNLSITSTSDIDMLGLYIKSCFVAILNANKLLPFDTMGIMASSWNWQIKEGEDFEVTINSTANNSQQPTEWFIVKNENGGLTRYNILDTLIPDKNLGFVTYKIKGEKKGKNTFYVISRLKTPQGDKILSQQINFMVR